MTSSQLTRLAVLTSAEWLLLRQRFLAMLLLLLRDAAVGVRPNCCGVPTLGPVHLCWG